MPLVYMSQRGSGADGSGLCHKVTAGYELSRPCFGILFPTIVGERSSLQRRVNDTFSLHQSVVHLFERMNATGTGPELESGEGVEENGKNHVTTPTMFSRAATATRRQATLGPCLSCQSWRLHIFQRSFSASLPILRQDDRRNTSKGKIPDKINYNSSSFLDDTGAAEGASRRLVTASSLAARTGPTSKQPPMGVKMLVRDFIEDSLYNPHYGYFAQQATIFSAIDAPVDFSRFRDSAEFDEEIATRYAGYGPDGSEGPGRQIWHTPTELFQVRSTLL
jgi:hypothetical protein